MNRGKKIALIVALAQKLHDMGSWSGETHIQKAIYFLQELLHVSTEYNFTFYKYGPFSFELRDELTAMRADGLLDLFLMPPPYGPSLVPTEQAQEFLERFPKTLARYEEDLSFVAEQVRNKRVAELERLTTALYVTREVGQGSSVTNRALLINELKPQVSKEAAEAAVRALDQIDDALKARSG